MPQGDLARLLFIAFNPQQAKWEEASENLMRQKITSPETWQETRRSIFGTPQDINLPSAKERASLQQAREALQQLVQQGKMKIKIER